MDENTQALIQHLLGQQGGIGYSGAPVFGGASDALLYAFGSTTSAQMPMLSQTNNMGFLQKIREEYIDNGEDQTLNRIQEYFGIDQRASESLINMVPMFQQYVSTRTDLMGGAFSTAMQFNPLIGTATERGVKAQEDFKLFESDLYERVMQRTEAGELGGIQTTRDAGDVLTFAAQNGLLNTTGRRVDSAGQLVDVSPDEMADEAEKVLERFGGVIEAGKKIFAPGTKTADILQNLKGFTMNARTDDQAQQLAEELQNLQGVGTLTGASVEALVRSSGRMKEQLVDMGVGENLSDTIALRSSADAALQHAGAKNSTQQFADLTGLNFKASSFETYQAVNAQNMLRYMGETKQQEQIAAFAANNMAQVDMVEGEVGMLAPDVIDAIWADTGMMDTLLTQDQVQSMTETGTRAIAEGAAQERFDYVESRGGITEGSMDVAETYNELRFGAEADTGKAFKISQAVKTGDTDALTELLGKDVSTQDMAVLKNLETFAMADSSLGLADPIAQEEANILKSDIDTVSSSTGYDLKKPGLEGVMEAFAVKNDEKAFEKLKETAEVTKLDVSAEETRETLKQKGLVDEQGNVVQDEQKLRDAGIFTKRVAQEGEASTMEYYQVESSDSSVSATDTISNAESQSMSDEGTAFLQNLGVMLEGMLDTFFRKAKTELGQ